jgi:hypothetical protein
MKKALIILSGLIFSILFSSYVIPARWEHLGTRKINRDFDKDVIYVTHLEGTFNALKVKVTQKPVTMYDIKVHYGNGQVEDLRTRVHVAAGGESRVIDLKGGNRVIEKVVFRYETRGDQGKRARIHLFGRH